MQNQQFARQMGQEKKQGQQHAQQNQNQGPAPHHPMQQMPMQPVMQMPMPHNLVEQEMIGAIKIKDGLFIGDELASTDLEFVVANKVTHVINCAGKQVQNHWESIGVAYLTFFWLDQDNQLLLDPRDEAANAIFEFIEEALESTESVLVHSVRGQSRATCALAAYIMRKYKWSLLKSLEFLNSRRPDLEIRATFIQQLSSYAARLQNQMGDTISTKWDELSNRQPTYACDELLLRNTFINSQMGPIPAPSKDELKEKPRAIKWIDEAPKAAKKETDNTKENEKGEKKETENFVAPPKGLVTNDSSKDLVLQDPSTLKKIMNHRKPKPSNLKSAIKKFEKLDQNQLTGLKNFTELSKDPLMLPHYARSDSTKNALQLNENSTSQNPQNLRNNPPSAQTNTQGQNVVKAKRPDDKSDRDSRARRARLQVGKQISQGSSSADTNKQGGKDGETAATGTQMTSSVTDSQTDQKRQNNGKLTGGMVEGSSAPPKDLFYKKDSDRNILSGTDDDFWDEPDAVVSEVQNPQKTTNPSKKVIGLNPQDHRQSSRIVSDSDFEEQQPQKEQQMRKGGSQQLQSSGNSSHHHMRGSHQNRGGIPTVLSSDEQLGFNNTAGNNQLMGGQPRSNTAPSSGAGGHSRKSSNNFVEGQRAKAQMRQQSGAGGNNSRRSNRKQNLADDSLMTDQSDDERARLEFRGERASKNGRGQRGNSGRVIEKQRMASGGNITNIINNNNINNFIINDPTKAPPVFHMAQNHVPHQNRSANPSQNNVAASSSTGVGLEGSAIPMHQGGNLAQNHPVNNQQADNFMRTSQGYQMSTNSASQQQQAALMRPRKQAQQFRSNSLTNRKDFIDLNSSGRASSGQHPRGGVGASSSGSGGAPMGIHFDRNGRPIGSSQGARSSTQKRKNGSQHPNSATNNMNSTHVVSIVKKELQKRHESPRSRRQLINNLAGPQSYVRGHGPPNQLLAGTSGAQTMIHQFQKGGSSAGQQSNGAAGGGQMPNQSFSTSAANTNDLTFFDSKMFSNGVGHNLKQNGSRSVGGRASHNAQGGNSAAINAKFNSKSADTSMFFNRTGPIKIPHKSGTKMHHHQGGGSGNHTNQGGPTGQNMSQQVEDMFNLMDDSHHEEQPHSQQVRSSGNNRHGRGGLNQTQPLKSQSYYSNQTHGQNAPGAGRSQQPHGTQLTLLGQARNGGPSSSQPGSRRELPENGGKVQGVGSLTRPGTAPQNMNGLLGGGHNLEKQRGSRPMSPFTKVYSQNNVSFGSGLRSGNGGHKGARSGGVIKSGSGAQGMVLGGSGNNHHPKTRHAGNSQQPSNQALNTSSTGAAGSGGGIYPMKMGQNGSGRSGSQRQHHPTINNMMHGSMVTKSGKVQKIMPNGGSGQGSGVHQNGALIGGASQGTRVSSGVQRGISPYDRIHHHQQHN